jgi:hypothetical protein
MMKPLSNHALENLAVLVGEWSTEVTNMSFNPDPSAIVRGEDRIEWLQGGAFLIIHSGVDESEFPVGVMVIGRDESVDTYDVLYFDSRNVSRIYSMSLEGKTWKMWRDAPGFAQRFTGTISDDGNTIVGFYEKCEDGSTWERDFDITYYKKVG